MSIFLWFTLFIASAWALAYYRAPLLVCTIVIAALLTVYTLLTTAVILPIVWWVLFTTTAVAFNLPLLRRRLISDRVFPVIKRAMPSMSQTEQDALDAGSVWWDGELFNGRPDWKKLLAMPAPTLTEPEQAFIDGPVEQLCAMLDDWKITNEDCDLPPEAWRFIKDHGFFGMIIPKEYGGLGFSALAHSSVVVKISSRCTSAAVTVMVPNSLGPAELLLRYGTEQQKKHYLPRLASGAEVPCFALTGPEAGSDAAAMPDKGIVCHGEFRGETDVLGIRLNWNKRYITLGPIATVLGLAFKLYDPDQLLGKQEKLGITLALIPADTPGITIGRRHMPLNSAFQNGPTSGTDVFIPIDQIIGGAERIGQGWRMLMDCLAAGRAISLPALSTGGSKLVCRATGAYARIRKQFKIPIGHFEGVEEALARMAGYTYQMDAARIVTAGAVDQGEQPAVVSAIVKYTLTERMRTILNDAMDIQGGSGICMGPRNLLARLYQSIPVGITVEGANILTRSLIIFGQGAIRCHPCVIKEMQAVANPDPNAGRRDFDKAFFQHVGFTISNALRALFLGLTKARLVIAPPGQEQYYYRQLTRLSTSFALCADISMLMLGGALKRKEKLSGRLADVLSQMYLASATLKHFHNQGQNANDLPLLRWACDDALYQAQEGLFALWRNFPNRPVAWMMRLLSFPYGRSYTPPSDHLGHTIAALLLAPSAVRDRLTAGIFIPEGTDQALRRLDDALEKVLAADIAERKLIAARHSRNFQAQEFDAIIDEALAKEVIDAQEAEHIRAAHAARIDVIQVDDFAPEYLSAPKHSPTYPETHHGAT